LFTDAHLAEGQFGVKDWQWIIENLWIPSRSWRPTEHKGEGQFKAKLNNSEIMYQCHASSHLRYAVLAILIY